MRRTKRIGFVWSDVGRIGRGGLSWPSACVDRRLIDDEPAHDSARRHRLREADREPAVRDADRHALDVKARLADPLDRLEDAAPRTPISLGARTKPSTPTAYSPWHPPSCPWQLLQRSPGALRRPWDIGAGCEIETSTTGWKATLAPEPPRMGTCDRLPSMRLPARALRKTGPEGPSYAERARASGWRSPSNRFSGSVASEEPTVTGPRGHCRDRPRSVRYGRSGGGRSGFSAHGQP
jgi:hypothetical protein